MSDIAVLIATVENTLTDIAKQSAALGVGLQNAAPGEKAGTSNKSVDYLLAVAELLKQQAVCCHALQNSKEQKDKLLALMRETLMRDGQLRDEFNAGDKFRFIRDRLQVLLTKVEDELRETNQDKEMSAAALNADEVLIYLYLYNTQGIVMQTWQKMLSPSVLYDHSVNRPVYIEKKHIDEFIHTKANKNQHGYLTMAVKKEAVMQLESLKDAMGHPLVRVKEGSLKFERLFSFTHNEHEYDVDVEGNIKKKSSTS